jgi:thioredoxin reductase
VTSKGRAKALFGSEVTEILGDRVRLKMGERTLELPNDYVFVFAGGEPPFALLRQMGIRFGGDGSKQALAASGPRKSPSV